MNKIIITDDLDLELDNLKNTLDFYKVFKTDKDFLLENAKELIREAHIAENKLKHLIICANNFTVIAQNALLKLLEEPLKNVEFIILSTNKAALLQTIRSRIIVLKHMHNKKRAYLDINFKNLKLNMLYNFVQDNKNLDKNNAKRLIEDILFKAFFIEKIHIDKEHLTLFEKAYKLIDLNSNIQSILLILLFPFLKNHKA